MSKDKLIQEKLKKIQWLKSELKKTDDSYHPATHGGSHFIFSAENPRGENKTEMAHEHVMELLAGWGEKAEEVHGKYDQDERSIIVHDPKNIKDLHELARDLGQEAAIVSDGGNHEMHYYTGPNAGMFRVGKGTDIHPEQPENYFTRVTNDSGQHSYFSHNFDWSDAGLKHPNELKKSIQKKESEFDSHGFERMLRAHHDERQKKIQEAADDPHADIHLGLNKDFKRMLWEMMAHPKFPERASDAIVNSPDPEIKKTALTRHIHSGHPFKFSPQHLEKLSQDNGQVGVWTYRNAATELPIDSIDRFLKGGWRDIANLQGSGTTKMIFHSIADRDDLTPEHIEHSYDSLREMGDFKAANSMLNHPNASEEQKDRNVHPGHMKFSVNTNKMRQLRDFIEEKGGRIHKKEAEQKGFSLKKLGLTDKLEDQKFLSADVVDDHIKKQPKLQYRVSHSRYGTPHEDFHHEYEDEAFDELMAENPFSDWLKEQGVLSDEGEFVDWISSNVNYRDFVDVGPDDDDDSISDKFWDHVDTSQFWDEYIDDEGEDNYVDTYTHDQYREDLWEKASERAHQNASDYAEDYHFDEYYSDYPDEANEHAANEQRHDYQQSKVFLLDHGLDHENDMKAQGIWNDYQKFKKQIENPHHPGNGNTVGWVRYTEKDDGIHVDEIQSDLYSALRKLNSRIKAGETVMDDVDFDQESIPKIMHTLFGNNHPSQIMHDAFVQHKRNAGAVNKPIHIWDAKSKAPISMQAMPREEVDGKKVNLTHYKNLKNEDKQYLIDLVREKYDRDKNYMASGRAPKKFNEEDIRDIDEIGHMTPENIDAWIHYAKKDLKSNHFYTDARSKMLVRDVPVNKIAKFKIPGNNEVHPFIQDKPLPQHMVEGYNKQPKAMGYEKGEYGQISTQTNIGDPDSGHAGKATWKDKIRKVKPEKHASDELEKFAAGYQGLSKSLKKFREILQKSDESPIKRLVEQMKSIGERRSFYYSGDVGRLSNFTDGNGEYIQKEHYYLPQSALSRMPPEVQEAVIQYGKKDSDGDAILPADQYEALAGGSRDELTEKGRYIGHELQRTLMGQEEYKPSGAEIVDLYNSGFIGKDIIRNSRRSLPEDFWTRLSEENPEALTDHGDLGRSLEYADQITSQGLTAISNNIINHLKNDERYDEDGWEHRLPVDLFDHRNFDDSHARQWLGSGLDLESRSRSGIIKHDKTSLSTVLEFFKPEIYGEKASLFNKIVNKYNNADTEEKKNDIGEYINNFDMDYLTERAKEDRNPTDLAKMIHHHQDFGTGEKLIDNIKGSFNTETFLQHSKLGENVLERYMGSGRRNMEAALKNEQASDEFRERFFDKFKADYESGENQGYFDEMLGGKMTDRMLEEASSMSDSDVHRSLLRNNKVELKERHLKKMYDHNSNNAEDDYRAKYNVNVIANHKNASDEIFDSWLEKHPIKESVNTFVHSHKLRQLRDFAEENGGVISKKQAEKAGFNMKSLKAEDLVDPKGKIAADDIQTHIDAAEHMPFAISHDEYGDQGGVDVDDWDNWNSGARDEALETHMDDARDHYPLSEYINNSENWNSMPGDLQADFTQYVIDEEDWTPEEPDEDDEDDDTEDVDQQIEDFMYNNADDYFESWLENNRHNRSVSNWMEAYESDWDDEIRSRAEDDLGDPSDYDLEGWGWERPGEREEDVIGAGEQRHSTQLSDVFQLNLHPKVMRQMKKEGLWDTYKYIDGETRYGGHPNGENGLGWVRYTGDRSGIHIDEIQSDFGIGMIKKFKQLKKKAADGDQHAIDILKQHPEENWSRVNELMYNGHHPSQVLHDSFLQHLRDKGMHDTPVHIWHSEGKAPIARQDVPEKTLMGHGKSKKGGWESGEHAVSLALPDQIKPESWKHVFDHLSSNVDSIRDDHSRQRVRRDLDEYFPVNEETGVRVFDHNDPDHTAILREIVGISGNSGRMYRSPSHVYVHKKSKVPVITGSGKVKTGSPLPVHMQETYDKQPAKMGYTKDTYGDIDTQTNSILQDREAPTMKDKVRKTEEEL